MSVHYHNSADSAEFETNLLKSVFSLLLFQTKGRYSIKIVQNWHLVNYIIFWNEIMSYNFLHKTNFEMSNLQWVIFILLSIMFGNGCEICLIRAMFYNDSSLRIF